MNEREKYTRAWREPRYRVKAHGLELWRTRPEIFPKGVRSALDIGCGHGRLMAHWREIGIDASGVDTVNALDREVWEKHGSWLIVCPLWDMPTKPPFDLGVAADVLEHLPPERVDASLRAIAGACEVVVVQTAEFPHRSMGMDLHLTMQPAAWWIDRMLDIGGSVDELPCYEDGKHLLRWRTGDG